VHDDLGLGAAAYGVSLRESAARGLLLTVGCLVAAGTAELLFRVGGSKQDPREYAAFRKSQVPGLDYEFVPGVSVPWAGREIRTNSQGFRGPDFSKLGGSGPRIAVIGDSIAAGYGVAEDDALPYRMAALMREQGLHGEVLGFGVPGYNIQQLALLWENKVLPYHPAIVVYAMCLNDARPELTLSPRGVLVAAGTVELSPERALPGRLPIPGKDWLHEHSLLYGFAVSRYDILLRRLGFRGEPLPSLDQIEQLYLASPEGTRFRSLLGRLAASVESTGAGFVLVCFPVADQLRTSNPRPQIVLGALAQTLGIEFVDLYPAFHAAADDRPERLLDADGLHPNATGHALAAAEILTVLRPWIMGGARHSARASRAP
jgi:lysophospholipase L1-like esterase